MHDANMRAVALAAALLTLLPTMGSGQHTGHDMPASLAHSMWRADLGAGWSVTGMAQAFPIVTIGAPSGDETPLRETTAYLTQSALMFDVMSAGERFVLRTTLNLEGLTQEDGETSYGAWGEGFIDRRHPHTLLHELMLSANAWSVAGGAASISAGRGFVAFGTEDPMGRPVVKYPTNHHLSQILERWNVTGAFLRAGWGVEASVFGGNEPEDAWDVSNLAPFGNSIAARVSKRWGAQAEWEASASWASITEEHGDDETVTRLANASLRYASASTYAMVEAARSAVEHDASYFSVLGEARMERGRHAPYARLEYATRPEWQRLGEEGDDFFRYDHDDEPSGSTRWFIATAGWGFRATPGLFSVRPFAEVAYHHVERERVIDPATLFARSDLWSLTFGARLFLGGPMRMGTYGILDPMTMGVAR